MNEDPRRAATLSRSAHASVEPLRVETTVLTTTGAALQPVDRPIAVADRQRENIATPTVTTAAPLAPIPMSRARLWNEIRTVVPYIVFAAALAAAVWLWRHHVAPPPLG